MEEQRARLVFALPPLSNDILFKIFSFLPPASLARASMVCSLWRSIIEGSDLWRTIYDELNKRLELLYHDMTAKNIHNPQMTVLKDWKSAFVKKQHRALAICGRVTVKDWKGHSSRAECCRFQMDTILTGSGDGMVCAWCTRTLHRQETYAVPNKSRVVDLEFDGTKILAASGTEVYIWRRQGGRLLRHISGHGQHIHSMCYADPDVFVGCADGTIRVFDVYSSHCTRIFRQHTEFVSSVVVDVNSGLLASGSADGTVKLCDCVSGEKISCLLPSLPPTGVTCLHLQSDRSILIAGTTAGHVHAWDVKKLKQLWSVRVGSNSVTSMHSQFYDATTLVVGSINGVITILDGEIGTIWKRYALSQKDGAATSNKSKVLSLDHKGVSFSLENIPKRNGSPILCLRVGMTKLVTTHPDGRIRLWKFTL